MGYYDTIRAKMSELGRSTIDAGDFGVDSEMFNDIMADGGQVSLCHCGELSFVNRPCSCYCERMDRKQSLQAHAQGMACCNKQDIAAYGAAVAYDLYIALKAIGCGDYDHHQEAQANESLVTLQELTKLLGINNSYHPDSEDSCDETGHDQLSSR
jgi:hypothetical protein